MTAISTDTEEDLSGALAPADLAASLAAAKALAARDAGAKGTVLAFDTIVVHDGAVMGKPADREDARRMLQALSGAMHEVVTGVAILADSSTVPDTFSVATPVAMRELSGADIEAWVAGDECLGCAGAYNIEHHLASVADDQCFQNVAGLPLCHIYRELAEGRAGQTPAGLRPSAHACDDALHRHCVLGPLLCGTVRG